MIFTDYTRACYFDDMVYAEIVVAEAEKKKKMDYSPKLNYKTIVETAASWLEDWLTLGMPRPSELFDLESDAFLMVMKSQRKLPTMDNFKEFVNAFRCDVLSHLTKKYQKMKIGISTNYRFKK